MFRNTIMITSFFHKEPYHKNTIIFKQQPAKNIYNRLLLEAQPSKILLFTKFLLLQEKTDTNLSSR